MLSRFEEASYMEAKPVTQLAIRLVFLAVSASNASCADIYGVSEPPASVDGLCPPRGDSFLNRLQAHDAQDPFENRGFSKRRLQQVPGAGLLSNNTALTTNGTTVGPPDNPFLVNATAPTLQNNTNDTTAVTADNPLLVNSTALILQYNLTEIFLKLNITKLPKTFNLTRIIPALIPTVNLTALYLALNITMNITNATLPLNITHPPPPPAYLCYGILVEYQILGNLTRTQYGATPAYLYTAEFKVQVSRSLLSISKCQLPELATRGSLSRKSIVRACNKGVKA
jgi:hypothetical protein